MVKNTLPALRTSVLGQVILTMLCCLPLLGSFACSGNQAHVAADIPETPSAPAGSPALKPYSVEECRYEVVTKGANAWSLGWTLSLKNQSHADLALQATLQFLFPTGHVLYNHPLSAVVLLPGEQKLFSGSLSLPVGIAQQVDKVDALVTTMREDTAQTKVGADPSLPLLPGQSNASVYTVTDCIYIITGTVGNDVELRWRLIIKNLTTSAIGMSVQVVFQDKGNGEMGRSDELAEIWVDPLSEQTFRGISYLFTEDYLVQNIDYLITVLH